MRELQAESGGMKQDEELKQRTKQFAIRIVNLFRSLPKSEDARVLGRQV